jgi:hypothetical protein
MRSKLALAALAGGIAVAVLPAAPASAACTFITGVGCVNVSCTVTAVYRTADRLAGDKLPDVNCLA